MTSALELDDVRARLAVAQADASKAVGEASQLGRLLINDRLRDEFTPARLASMREQLQVLRHALHDLEDVHADLRRRAEATVVGSTRQAGDPEPADEPSPTTGPCRQCRRDDALVALRICMRCTVLARGESGAPWVSANAATAGVLAEGTAHLAPRGGTR